MPATLSISCSTPAASSGGNASSSRKLVTNCAHTKNGIRKKPSPLARSCTIVTMKLTEPSSDDVIRKIMPMSHHVCPFVAVMTESGGYEVQPDCAAPPGMKKLASITHAADEVHPVARHVELGERHVGRADHQRHHVVAEAADGERHDAEEHHDGAVHGAELVVELRQHDAARRVRRAEQRSDDGNRLHRKRELIAHQRHQAESEQQKQQRRDRVLNPDDLVVLGKNPLRDEALLVMICVRVACVAVRVGACRRVSRCRHVIQLRDSFVVGLNLS